MPNNEANNPVPRYSIADPISGLEGRVHECRRGWAVVLLDLDSGERLPSVRIYKANELVRAMAYARRIVAPNGCGVVA